MRKVTAGTWLNISEGCDLRCAMHGSDAAYVAIGESDIDYELTFDYASFAEFVTQATAVLKAMDTKANEEEAEWVAQADLTDTNP
ncbi:MAG TPA: hypothetical protein VG756_21785 [Pseudonocardiaceae bacterium]|nr:hypothetical protein [Pseudonocardiaceae bacterium]